MRKTIITTMMAREMTELRALGVPIARIARQFNLHVETVRLHTSEEDAAIIRERQTRRYQKERQIPEIVERRRAVARDYARRQREDGTRV